MQLNVDAVIGYETLSRNSLGGLSGLFFNERNEFFCCLFKRLMHVSLTVVRFSVTLAAVNKYCMCVLVFIARS